MKAAEKQYLLYQKLVAGVKVRESEYPAWQRGVRRYWTPRDETRNRHQFRIEYEQIMRETYGPDWQPNPAAVDWGAYHARERGDK